MPTAVPPRHQLKPTVFCLTFPASARGFAVCVWSTVTTLTGQKSCVRIFIGFSSCAQCGFAALVHRCCSGPAGRTLVGPAWCMPLAALLAIATLAMSNSLRPDNKGTAWPAVLLAARRRCQRASASCVDASTRSLPRSPWWLVVTLQLRETVGVRSGRRLVDGQSRRAPVFDGTAYPAAVVRGNGACWVGCPGARPRSTGRPMWRLTGVWGDYDYTGGTACLTRGGPGPRALAVSVPRRKWRPRA